MKGDYSYLQADAEAYELRTRIMVRRKMFPRICCFSEIAEAGLPKIGDRVSERSEAWRVARRTRLAGAALEAAAGAGEGVTFVGSQARLA